MIYLRHVAIDFTVYAVMKRHIFGLFDYDHEKREKYELQKLCHSFKTLSLALKSTLK